MNDGGHRVVPTFWMTSDLFEPSVQAGRHEISMLAACFGPSFALALTKIEMESILLWAALKTSPAV